MKVIESNRPYCLDAIHSPFLTKCSRQLYMYISSFPQRNAILLLGGFGKHDKGNAWWSNSETLARKGASKLS